MKNSEFKQISGGGVCAIVGSGLALAPSAPNAIISGLVKKFGISPDFSEDNFWLKIAEIARSPNANPPHVRDELKLLYRRCQLGRWLQSFCQVNLRAVISLSPDPHLGESLQSELSKSPTLRQVQRISSGNEQPKRGFLPLYLALGDSEFPESYTKVPITRAEFLARKRVWRSMLSDFKDIAKNRPIVCIGLKNEIELLYEILNELLESYPTLGRSLYFMESESFNEDATLNEMIGQQAQEVSEDIWADLGTANSPSQFITTTSSAPGANLYDELLKSKFEIPEFFLVPSADDIAKSKCGRNQAIDVLFRPNSIDWSPYAQQLDFEREQSEMVLSQVLQSLKTTRSGSPEVILVRGEAGVGKTVALKRIAFDLSNENIPCLWVNTPLGDPSLRSLKTIIERFAQFNDSVEPIVIFVDIGSYGKRICNSFVEYFSGSSSSVVIVCAMRNSDTLADPTGDIDGLSEIELAKDLSEIELSNLPEYLARLEIAQDKESAEVLISRLDSKNARDVLCLFWFLVPQSREAISGALSDEYFSLGRKDSTIAAYAEEARRQGETAKKAYEFAAVAANVQVPLPTEVLVNALGIDYHEWSSFAGKGTPLWGLIYAIEWPEADTVVYKTRNEVVTQHLIQLIDGSSLGRTGQLGLLKELISVCDSTLPIYRDFLVELLVRRKQIITMFEFEEQMNLYDLALDVLPSADRSIAHHRALCMKDRGDDPLGAYMALVKAGEMEASVISESDEPQENIETSAAAAALAAVEKGHISEEEGAGKVRRHVERAIDMNPYNMYTYHVSANHLLKLAHRMRAHDTSQAAACLSESARTVRRALSLRVSTNSSHRASSSEEMLKSLRVRIAQENLLGEDLSEIVEQLISQGALNDPRLEAALRLLLLKAQESGKGRDFNAVHDLVLKIVGPSDDPLNDLPADIVSIWIEVLTDWKVSTRHDDQTWLGILEGCNSLTKRSGYISNPVWNFWQGVASFQLAETHAANAVFHQLRAKPIPGPLKFADRFRYVDSLGNSKNFTGTIKEARHFGGNQYVYVPDLGTDLLCGRGEFSSSAGSTVVINIAFSFAGPRAVKPYTH